MNFSAKKSSVLNGSYTKYHWRIQKESLSACVHNYFFCLEKLRSRQLVSPPMRSTPPPLEYLVSDTLKSLFEYLLIVDMVFWALTHWRDGDLSTYLLLPWWSQYLPTVSMAISVLNYCWYGDLCTYCCYGDLCTYPLLLWLSQYLPNVAMVISVPTFLLLWWSEYLLWWSEYLPNVDMVIWLLSSQFCHSGVLTVGSVVLSVLVSYTVMLFTISPKELLVASSNVRYRQKYK